MLYLMSIFIYQINVFCLALLELSRLGLLVVDCSYHISGDAEGDWPHWFSDAGCERRREAWQLKGPPCGSCIAFIAFYFR